MTQDKVVRIDFTQCDVRIGRMFDIHDNGTVNVFTTTTSEAPTDASHPDDAKVEPQPMGEARPAVVTLETELLAIFLNDIDEVRAFVRAIDGARPTFVTSHVNNLLRQQKVTRAGCKRPLWEVLHRYHLYNPSESNWNQQVNA